MCKWALLLGAYETNRLWKELDAFNRYRFDSYYIEYLSIIGVEYNRSQEERI